MKARTGVLVALLAVVGCGGGTESGGSVGGGEASSAAAAGSELSAEQLAKGIGPITSVTLGEVDAALAEQGKATFTLKCSACHKLETRYVAPQLGGVLERRTPEFVMNMILNPAEMTAKHPETKKLLAEYLLAMPDQNLTEAEARAVLEYIRSWKQP
jgi:cytochrome c2